MAIFNLSALLSALPIPFFFNFLLTTMFFELQNDLDATKNSVDILMKGS